MPPGPTNTAVPAAQRGASPVGTRWILASSSPRRKELLDGAGQTFDVVPSAIEEVVADEEPEIFASRMAQEKAAEVAKRHPGRWVLGADTIVAIHGRILGKPTDATDAERMLRGLSGRSHDVITSFVLLDPSGRRFGGGSVRTRVTFRDLSDAEITRYVASGEPRDKAGAYAIQGGAAAFVREVAGSWTNVVGLPLEEVSRCLERSGLWRRAPRTDEEA